MTELTTDEAREYTDALGQVVAGGYRQVALGEKLGVPKALGLTTRDWGQQELGGYVRLSIEERREAVAELTVGDDPLNNVQAAAVLGVDEITVRRDRESTNVEEPEQSAPNSSTNVDAPHVAKATGDNEWYTPSRFIAAARMCMGGIDLDPATSVEANAAINADRFYTLEDDGLNEPWAGRVWLNPPYAGDLVGKFTGKLRNHFVAGEVTSALVLVNNATETTWFQQLASDAVALCFPSSRVKFWGPNKNTGAPLQGQVVVYLGADTRAFTNAFISLGLIYYAG